MLGKLYLLMCLESGVVVHISSSTLSQQPAVNQCGGARSSKHKLALLHCNDTAPSRRRGICLLSLQVYHPHSYLNLSLPGALRMLGIALGIRNTHPNCSIWFMLS